MNMNIRLNPKYTRADTDGQFYLRDETEWKEWPNPGDSYESFSPGILGPVAGAVPVSEEVAFSPDPIRSFADQPQDNPSTLGNVLADILNRKGIPNV